MTRTIIVTGSAGLIGSESVRRFASDGARVIGIDNDMRANFFGVEASTKKTRDDLIANFRDYEHHDLDIRDATAVMDLFKQQRGTIEAIVHTAAQPSHDWAARDPQTDFTVNANGTLNLLEAARKFSPEAPFIFTSTNKVYGETPNGLPLRELEKRWEIEPGHEYESGISETMSIDYTKHSIFGASKAAADILVQEYGRYFGMPTVSFRGGCLTGPRRHRAAWFSLLPDDLCRKRPIVPGFRVQRKTGPRQHSQLRFGRSVCAIHPRPARWRSLQHRRQPAQQLFDARSHRNVRTDQRQEIKMELRGNQSHRRPHVVDQRRAKVPDALSKLEISLRFARYAGRNLQGAYRMIYPQIAQIYTDFPFVCHPERSRGISRITLLHS
jgi:nucleoside-diphosphate-sugar epimerase